MKFSALLLLLVSAIAASVVPSAYGLEEDAKGAHLRQLQDQPSGQDQPQQPGFQNVQPQQPGFPNVMSGFPNVQPQQPNVPYYMLGGMNTGNTMTTTNTNPGSNEIMIGGCFPGSWDWPRCRYGCFPGSWNWPRCRYGGGGGGGCFPGSWSWPRCRWMA
ncbi:hypothetical protein PR003_g14305 [Phytophthora rubi]|uniref:CBM1 domain-containing protein n=1 Tax=Phytophthora rubi TaxID=129364 RepID=A0A6A3LYJ6_9STRA|nr:hypothetical protein PR002_g13801 [Phytophthora rubi]KAE9021003.1 hypothetical protein PR001_g13459 [Phytophthora rubi]KAE9332851.1 hypothetical protein PR003_g14305 [Phytophthora rubi]